MFYHAIRYVSGIITKSYLMRFSQHDCFLIIIKHVSLNNFYHLIIEGINYKHGPLSPRESYNLIPIILKRII